MMQEFIQKLTDNMKDEIGNIHTAFPGTIISFDPSAGIASVQPSVKYRLPDGSTMDYPYISGVPVIFPQSVSGEAVIAYPVKAGDGCLVIVSEKSLDYWMYGQETGTSLDFDLTNAICIPGLFAKPGEEVKEACQKNAVIVKAKNSRITISPGAVDIDATSVSVKGNLSVSGTVTARNFVDRD